MASYLISVCVNMCVCVLMVDLYRPDNKINSKRFFQFMLR